MIVRLHRTYRLAVLLAIILLLSCISLIFLPLSNWFILLLVIGVLSVGSYFMARDALLALPSSWRLIEISHQGKIKLTQKNGQCREINVANQSVVTQHYIVLHESNLWWTYFYSKPVILMKDSLTADELRQLSVWLNWWKHRDSSVEPSQDTLN